MKTNRLVQLSVVAITVLIFRAGVTAAPNAPQANGIECGCGLTGDYVTPAHGKVISIAQEGTSPHGLYTVSVAGGPDPFT